MTQKEAVLQYIKDNGSITPAQAIYDLGITKLATVISTPSQRRSGDTKRVG